jgi:hypothetical protein
MRLVGLKARTVLKQIQREGKSMTVPVHKGGRVYIEGVRRWTPREMANSVIAAEVVAMQAAGEDVSYAFQMGVSGSAFRLQVSPGWCPSSPHSFCGYKTIAGAVEALPYRLEAHEAKPEDAEGVNRAREAVRASIDRGLPCVYGDEEDGLIVGYQNDGHEWLCIHPYHDGEDYFMESKWPWGVGVFTDRKDPPPDRRRCVVNSLRLALKLARLRQAPGGTEPYNCGFHAWTQWTEQLRDDALFANRDKKELGLRAMGNAWIYHCLIDARRSAVEYLTGIANLFDHEAATHLARASGLYRTMVADVLGRRDPREIAPPPVWLAAGRPWTDEMRHAQAALLTEALAIEREALGEIEQGLSEEGTELTDAKHPA